MLMNRGKTLLTTILVATLKGAFLGLSVGAEECWKAGIACPSVSKETTSPCTYTVYTCLHTSIEIFF